MTKESKLAQVNTMRHIKVYCSARQAVISLRQQREVTNQPRLRPEEEDSGCK